jgi:hypothetical protein
MEKTERKIAEVRELSAKETEQVSGGMRFPTQRPR